MKKSPNQKVRKKRTEYVRLNVLPDDLWLKVRVGDTIYEALQHTDIDFDAECSGLGKCGKCKVRVLTSIESPSQDELEFLDQEEIDQGIRLACRTPIHQDMVIQVGDADTGEEQRTSRC